LNVTVPGTAILVLYLGVFFCAFALAAHFIISKSMEFLILPFVWVILEFIRGNLFSGFPWALLGYSQYMNSTLIQIADITGAYGVSFILVAFNTAVFAWITGSKRKISYMMVSLLFIAVSISYARYRFDNDQVLYSPKVSVVQGNIPQNLKWNVSEADNIISIYEDLSLRVTRENPDIILWPETAYPYLLEKNISAGERGGAITEKLKIPVLAGCVTREGNAYYNSAVLFNKGQMDKIYRKTHLVPFGEYIPFEWVNSKLRDYVDKPIGDFLKGTEYTLFPLKGTSVQDFGKEIIRTTGYYEFGVLICFEDVFPYISREFVKRGADFLVNITNDAWFNRTAASRQHLQASIFRAVENRVPVVRAANTGISCFIDPLGRIQSVLRDASGEEIFIRGTFTDNVNFYSGKSFYTFYGDSFVLFCMIMLIILFLTEGYFFFTERKGK
jgi:apolipoprotein N-acyltransferase